MQKTASRTDPFHNATGSGSRREPEITASAGVTRHDVTATIRP